MRAAQGSVSSTTHPGRSLGWQVEIVAGPNAGAIVLLDGGRHHFGRDRANDIVLADVAVAGHQASIEVAGRTARIETFAPGTQVCGRTLREGARLRLRHGTDIGLGETRLRVHAPVRSLFSLRLPLATAVAAAVVLAAMPLLRDVTHAHAATQDLSRSATDGSAALAHTAGPAPTPLPARLSPAGAANALRLRLAAQHLDGAISVQAAGGAVLATGAVLPAERERWLTEQMWFDATLGGTLALVDHVTVARAEELPRLDVRAVSAGAVPFVVTGSGDRYAEGSVLAGGWTITHIGADRITLRLGARSLDISL